MVLPDTEQPPSDSFNDNPAPSDNDTYSSSSSPPPPGSNGNQYRFNIDTSAFPHPIPVIAPLLGFSDTVMRITTGSTLAYAQIKVKRPLTQEEVQTLAFHVYESHQIASYTTAAGVAAGAARWYHTMDRNQYPMFKPKPETVNPNQFLFIKGALAQQARHSWRFAVWTMFAGTLGKFVGLAYAQPTAARNSANDPKLAQFTKDLRTAMTEERGQPGGTKQVPHAGQPRPIVPPRKAPAAAPAATPSYDDDMSPTAGNESWPSQGSYAGDFSPDPVENQPDQPSRPSARSPDQSYRRPTRSTDDDMSPTDGMFEEETKYTPKPGESSWERLRRGGPPPSAASHPPSRRPEPLRRNEPREASNVGDTFAADERKRAREQAQREFDENLERERQGKDFSDEKKW